MNKLKSTVVCGALAVSMMASVMAGCGSDPKETPEIDGTQVAVTVNGEDINVGVVNCLLRYNQAHTREMLEGYGLDSESLWDKAYAEDAEGQEVNFYTGDLETYGDGLKMDTLNNIVYLTLLRQQADDLNVEIPEIYIKDIGEASDYTYTYNEELFERIGITKEDVVEFMELEAYGTYVKDAMVADTDREVSDDEAKQRKLTYVRAITATKDADGNPVPMSDEEIAALKADLQKVLDDVKASDDVAEADIAEIQKAINEEGLSTAVYAYGYGEDEFGICEEIHEVVQDLDDGELYDGIIETDGALYLVRLDAKVDADRTSYKKDSIIQDRENENFKTKMDEIYANAEVTVSSYYINNIKVSDKDDYVSGGPKLKDKTEAVEDATVSASSAK